MNTPENQFERNEVLPRRSLGERILADERGIPVEDLPEKRIRRKTGASRPVPPIPEDDSSPKPYPDAIATDF